MGARNNNSENIVRECVQGREHSIGVTAEDGEKAQERRAGAYTTRTVGKPVLETSAVLIQGGARIHQWGLLRAPRWTIPEMRCKV